MKPADIISAINTVAIIVLFVIIFYKKEPFANVPSGASELMLTDSSGNLYSMALTDLQADIEGINTLKNYYDNSTRWVQGWLQAGRLAGKLQRFCLLIL